MDEKIPGPNGSMLKTDSECDCKDWASDGRLPLLNHHRNCQNYSPIFDLTEILKSLVVGIESWASDEDGVHDDCYEAYKKAKFTLGQFDIFKKEGWL